MRNYFKGMYFKCQSDTQMLAIIPSVHEVLGKKFYSIQVITEDGAWYARIAERQDKPAMDEALIREILEEYL